MSATQIKINTLAKGQFTVFETDDGITPESGLAGSMSIELFKGGAISAEATSVAEIGTTGTYIFEFTPNAEDVWMIKIFVPQTGDTFACRFMVSDSDLDTILDKVCQIDVNVTQIITTLGTPIDTIAEDILKCLSSRIQASGTDC